VKNIWCDLCQEVWNWRNREVNRGEMTKVQCIEYGRKDAIEKRMLEQEKREILCPECRIERKKL